MAVTGWFTLPNGTHIPIIDGESKTKALSNFIKSKREKGNFAKRRKKKQEFNRLLEMDEERFNRAYPYYRESWKDQNIGTQQTVKKPTSSAYNKAMKNMDTFEDKIGERLLDKYSKRYEEPNEGYVLRQAKKIRKRKEREIARTSKLDKTYGKYKLKTKKDE